MLEPKKVKFRKVQRGRMRGKAHTGNKLDFGDYGLQALECGNVSARQIEAARISMYCTQYCQPDQYLPYTLAIPS